MFDPSIHTSGKHSVLCLLCSHLHVLLLLRFAVPVAHFLCHHRENTCNTGFWKNETLYLTPVLPC